MNFGNIQGLVNGTESVVASYVVTGSAVTSIDLGSVFNGDEDGWYTVIVRHIYDTATSTLNLYFNTDNTASNYGYRGITANNTTVANINSTSALIRLCSVASGTTSGFSVLRLYAKQGAVRLCNGVNVCDISGTTVTQLETIGSIWNNTNTNITKMVLAPSAGKCGVGTEVYVLKSNNFTNGTPTGVITTPYIKGSWVRVGSQVLGSAASSVTFSGLDGDRDVVYYLSTASKVEANGQNIDWYFDANTSDYGRQFLAATNTTVSAARDTGNPAFCGGGSTSALYQTSTHLIFAKQGSIRPSISQVISSLGGTTITSIYILGNSYSVTNTNIGSMTVRMIGGGNNISTGSQFDLFALRPNG